MGSDGLRSSGAGTSINGTTQYRFVSLVDNNVSFHTKFLPHQIIPYAEANNLKNSLTHSSNFEGILPEKMKEKVESLFGVDFIPTSAFSSGDETWNRLFELTCKVMSTVDPYDDDEHHLVDSIKQIMNDAIGGNYYVHSDRQWDGSGLPNFAEGLASVLTKPKPDIGYCLASTPCAVRRHHNETFLQQLPVLSTQYLALLMKHKGVCASPTGPSHLNSAYPFLIVEGKTVVGSSLFVAQNQMAGGLAKALGMLQQLVRNRLVSDLSRNLPVLGVSFQGPIFEIWIACREELHSNLPDGEFATHLYPIAKCLDISNVWDTMRIIRMLQSIGKWASSVFQPNVEQALETYRSEFASAERLLEASKNSRDASTT